MYIVTPRGLTLTIQGSNEYRKGNCFLAELKPRQYAGPVKSRKKGGNGGEAKPTLPTAATTEHTSILCQRGSLDLSEEIFHK